MKPNLRFVALIALLATSCLSGCASIISGRRADITIDSYPNGAHVVVEDYKGRPVASLQTPGTVSLKRNRAWFLPAKYTARFEAPGYEPVQVPIRSTVNPWIVGNAVIGGIPGLIVDNATGAAWKPKQTEIHRQLNPISGMYGPMISTNDTPPQPVANSETPPDPQDPAFASQPIDPPIRVGGHTSAGVNSTLR